MPEIESASRFVCVSKFLSVTDEATYRPHRRGASNSSLGTDVCLKVICQNVSLNDFITGVQTDRKPSVLQFCTDAHDCTVSSVADERC